MLQALAVYVYSTYYYALLMHPQSYSVYIVVYACCWQYPRAITSVVVEDQVVFYMVFEILLVVMYCTVGSYWYTARACYAMGVLVVYTVIGSSCMATAMLMQYCTHGAAYSYHGMEVQLLVWITATAYVHVSSEHIDACSV